MKFKGGRRSEKSVYMLEEKRLQSHVVRRVKTMKGLIKSLSAERQYGFIKASNGTEYFFHKNAFNGHWIDLVDDFAKPNSDPIRVTFIPSKSNKGPRAENVTRMDNGAPMDISDGDTDIDVKLPGRE